MKKIIFYVVIALLCGTSGYAQRNNRTTPSGKCLTAKEAESLLQKSSPMNKSITYVLEEALRYSNLSLSNVRRDFPVTYLFYQKGYLQMEDNEVHTFGFITAKGRELKGQYPDGIPLSSSPSVSVKRVNCSGKKLTVAVSVQAKPTQFAISLLGSGISKINLFGTPRKRIINLNFRNGRWQVNDSDLYYFTSIS